MSVSIIGCGWLGQALAASLQADKISVLASYQSQATLEKLKNLNIAAIQLSLPLSDLSVKNFAALFQQKILVIAIPPQLKKGKLDYPLKIQQLVQQAELGQTQHIILLNSTAIYNGLAGEVNESSALDLNAEKVSTLLAAEHEATKFSKQVHILRLSGLVGPNRHPGKFLQSNRVFTNASAQVNLVHQTDVVNIIQQLITSSVDNITKIYNVVSATKSDRKSYYQVAAKAMNLPIPNFEEEKVDNKGKQISGKKLRDELNYQYHYDDLLQWATTV